MLPRWVLRWFRRGHTFVKLPSDPVEQADLLAQFAGLWVAVWNDEVIAAEMTLDSLYRTLDEQGRPLATVFRVPDPKQGVFVGHL